MKPSLEGLPGLGDEHSSLFGLFIGDEEKKSFMTLTPGG
jgi:hypothetical protein